jgi:hypothetical protein
MFTSPSLFDFYTSYYELYYTKGCQILKSLGRDAYKHYIHELGTCIKIKLYDWFIWKYCQISILLNSNNIVIILLSITSHIVIPNYVKNIIKKKLV